MYLVEYVFCWLKDPAAARLWPGALLQPVQLARGHGAVQVVLMDCYGILAGSAYVVTDNCEEGANLWVQ